MSKSTPLSQLPNMNSGDSDKENQLVNDILNELDKNENTEQSTQQIEQQQENVMSEQMQQQAQQQAQQQQMQQQMQQQQMMQQQQQMQQSQQEQSNESVNLDNLVVDEPKSLADKITDMIKQPAIVAAICIFMSIPQLNNVLVSLLPKKEFILNNSNLFVLLLKGLFSGILFYVLNNSLI